MAGDASKLRRGFSAGLAIFSSTVFITSTAAQAADKLDLNDVSVLFDMPVKDTDLANVISIADLKSGGSDIWSDAMFNQFLAISNSPAGKVGGTPHRIALKSGEQPFDKKREWVIASFRVDPAAPGTDPKIIQQFGESPQIRLILQPVTQDPGADGVQVHDVTAHLIFNFTIREKSAPDKGCFFPKFKPDALAFKKVVDDLVALKKKFAAGQIGGQVISTAGKPLNVHPASKNKATAKAARDAFKAFLETHLKAERLSAMAVMGLPQGSGEPWIFVSMLVLPPGANPQLPNGGVIPVENPALTTKKTAQFLSFVGGPNVVPVAKTNNLHPATCSFNATDQGNNLLPPGKRRGVSTAELFGDDIEIQGKKARARANFVVDTIANASKSHFFNTDCVSCHTETHRAITRLKSGPRIRDIDPSVLPKSEYNVRNFGWGLNGGGIAPTITRRTKNETKDVLKFLNEKVLNK